MLAPFKVPQPGSCVGSWTRKKQGHRHLWSAKRGGLKTPSRITMVNLDCALAKKTTHVLHQSQIMKSHQNRIELVTRPSWPQRILNMKLTLVTNALYLATETSVMKVPVERCSRYLSKEQCHKAMDPYCGWNSRQRACTTQPKSGSAELSHWSQPQLECPAQNLPVSIQ